MDSTPGDFNIPELKAKLLALLGDDAKIYPARIEQSFPRILDRIVALWGKPGLDAYLDELMIASRPGRQGFPDDVAMELFRLSNCHSALGLTKQTNGFGWAGIEDAEMHRKEFTKVQK